MYHIKNIFCDNGEYFGLQKLDKEIIPILVFLAEQGFETEYSCSGHKDALGYFSICKSDSIIERKLISLMKVKFYKKFCDIRYKEGIITFYFDFSENPGKGLCKFDFKTFWLYLHDYLQTQLKK